MCLQVVPGNTSAFCLYCSLCGNSLKILSSPFNEFLSIGVQKLHTHNKHFIVKGVCPTFNFTILGQDRKFMPNKREMGIRDPYDVFELKSSKRIRRSGLTLLKIQNFLSIYKQVEN